MANVSGAGERRVSKRFKVQARTIFRTPGAVEGIGDAVNVGQKGILVKTSIAPPPGTAVLVYFKPGEQHFMVPGTVVWSNEHQAGITFEEEPHGLTDFLSSILPEDARQSKRQRLEMLIRIRRGESRTREIVEPVDASESGFRFESALEYVVGEPVMVIMNYRPNCEPPARETPAVIVRKRHIAGADTSSYGVAFVRES